MTINDYLPLALKRHKYPFLLMPMIRVDNNTWHCILVDPRRKNGIQMMWTEKDNHAGSDANRWDHAQRLLDGSVEQLVRFIPSDELALYHPSQDESHKVFGES